MALYVYTYIHIETLVLGSNRYESRILMGLILLELGCVWLIFFTSVSYLLYYYLVWQSSICTAFYPNIDFAILDAIRLAYRRDSVFATRDLLYEAIASGGFSSASVPSRSKALLKLGRRGSCWI